MPKRESQFKKTNTTFTVTFAFATFAGSLPDSDFGNTFPWLLAVDNREGERALRSFDDQRYFIWDSPPYDDDDVLAIAHIKDITEEEGKGDAVVVGEKEGNGGGGSKKLVIALSVKVKLKSKFAALLANKEAHSKGLEFLLQKRYTDPFTYVRELEYIKKMNEVVQKGSVPLCLRLLEDPKGWISSDEGKSQRLTCKIFIITSSRRHTYRR